MNYQVVHITTGRCRIRVPQVASDSEYVANLKWLVESLDFVTSVRINSAASSLIVSFDTCVVSSATAQEELFTCIQQASIAEIPLKPPLTEHEVEPQVNTWERLGLPVISLGIALLAGPLELSIPFLVVGGLVAGAGVPIFSRAIAGIVDERKFKVDVLDSLWITLQTLQGQYVAPALMINLMESAEALRDMTARANERQTLKLLDLPDGYAWVERDEFQNRLPLADTQVGDKVQEVADRLVVPTLFLSGGIFALTGNISPALAPLQLDFGTGIGIAVPTTILAALTYAARNGVYIRDGRALEVLARLDTVVFGLTGTLTEAIATSVSGALNEQGIKNYLLTSDNQQAFNEVVRGLHNDGKTVAYVGDRSSNTEALADADVSVCLAKGTEIERVSADVVLTGNDLTGLIHGISIAKQAMEIVYQNIALVAVPNITVVTAGVLFGLHPVWAVIINNCAALIAELNGRRPLLDPGNPAPRALIPGKDPPEAGSAILVSSS
jgi:cation transport ATPase